MGIQTMVRGSLRPASWPQEGTEDRRGRGRCLQQEEVEEEREEVQGTTEGIQGRTSPGRSVRLRPCPGLHLFSPRPVRSRRRLHPRRQGTRVLPEEDQG